ncbi:MAG: hypothetical protein AAGC83_06630, partial [Pseudomonadota bacterium]
MLNAGFKLGNPLNELSHALWAIARCSASGRGPIRSGGGCGIWGGGVCACFILLTGPGLASLVGIGLHHSQPRT